MTKSREFDQGWSQWYPHCGTKYPYQLGLVGKIIRVKFSSGNIQEGMIYTGRGMSWVWTNKGYSNSMEYRIKKPKGLTLLEELIEDFPTVVTKKVTTYAK